MAAPTMFHRLAAEMIGTFWLVFGGCGSAVFAAKFLSGGVEVGIGFLGVALTFGLTVLTGVYAFGTISGGHFNPAVTLGAALARRVEWKALPGYWIVQVIGGLLAGLLIYLIAKGKDGFTATGNMAANGFGEHSPGGFAMGGDPRRDRPDSCVPACHPGIHGRPGAQGIRRFGHRPDPHPDPPHLHPDLQHVGQPGALDGGRVLQRRRRTRAALGVLAGTTDRRGHRRNRVSVSVRQA